MLNIESISNLFKNNSPKIFCENFKFYIKKTENINEILTSSGIKFDDESDRLLLKINAEFTNLIPYNDLKLFELEYIENEFTILNTDGDYFQYKNGSNSIYNDLANLSFVNRCKNLVLYYKLFQFISSANFADINNEAELEIVLYSSINGIFKIKYDSIPTISENAIDENSIDNLISIINSLELKQFVKNAFFIFSQGTGVMPFNIIFENANDIVTTAKRDYELVAKQFNFKEFKDSLYKEKEKYFNDIREIIGKIFSQAVGIPISISATLFVTYKIPDNNIVLYLTLTSFLVYITFYVRIQLFYKSDLKEIKENFILDFEVISSSSGLDAETINSEKRKIERKISNSLTIINWLIISVLIMGVILALYIITQIYNNEMLFLSQSIIYISFLFLKYH